MIHLMMHYFNNKNSFFGFLQQMNNCVGVGNLKHFILFLVYTWTCSVFSLLLLGWNYFMCADEECAFNGVLTQLVRVVT